MKSFTHTTITFTTVLFMLLFPFLGTGCSSQTREPAYAGTFYPKDKSELSALIKEFTEKAGQTKISLPADKPLRALIMPHAGYIYSGLTAAHASLALKGRQFNKVIIMGPDHHVGFQGCAVSGVDQYETPLGKVKLHPDAAVLREQPDIFRWVKESDAAEHSIEVEIPFLQTYLQNFAIVPIVMSRGNIQQYSEAIEKIIDPETLIIVSSDLSHYLPYDEAMRIDNETIQMILNLDIKDLAQSQGRACGIIPILTLIQIAQKYDWKPVLIYYNNSGDTAGDKQKVVGYATIAFYGDLTMEEPKNSSRLTENKGETLLKLARKTIAKKLGIDAPETGDIADALKDKDFQAQRGTFVTLTINHQLRGCIGNLSADKSIAEGVRDNAIHAAFQDPRFRPLSKDEFDKIDIEVSLLTEPQPLKFKDANDLLAKLRPGIDGVIIRKGMYSSTFLPQVWDQLPDKEMFLDHLCSKAGLPAKIWRQPGLEVLTYQVQYFEEKH